MDDMYATWRGIEAPVLWIAASDSHVASWLARGGDGAAEIARRFAHIPNGRLEVVGDASHMLHHDQPAAVARLMEAFLDRENPR
jgi:pimeloyl-ACP methyl ester carboxylesterase